VNFVLNMSEIVSLQLFLQWVVHWLVL